MIKTAFVQQSNSSDIEDNVVRLKNGIREAANNGAQLIVLPELHNSLYFCQSENCENFDIAERIPGPSTSDYGSLAKELGVVIILSLFEKRAPGLYHNTAVVIESDGSLVGSYRKMHIPDDPGFYEKFYFTPGDKGFEPIDTSVGRLGVLVCWDQWYPEAARIMALKGAEILIYPTAIGWDLDDSTEEKRRQKDAWIISQRAHAISNALPVISVNRNGFEKDPSGQLKGIEFWGGSFICGQQGEITAFAGNDDAVVTEEISIARTEEVRRIWPFFRDRRIDEYRDILKRYDN
ncbi:carbon-nitrogen hydrolase [Marinilabiliaceae bacterium ANBcel2]|nr:carbon-nitrogen hydrolase [Marinilabiliaceae bacterium ANBcel2]